jgi:hypothetical protein
MPYKFFAKFLNFDFFGQKMTFFQKIFGTSRDFDKAEEKFSKIFDPYPPRYMWYLVNGPYFLHYDFRDKHFHIFIVLAWYKSYKLKLMLKIFSFSLTAQIYCFFPTVPPPPLKIFLNPYPPP